MAVGTREGGILVYDIRMAASGPLAEAPSFLPGVVASLDWQRPPLQRASPAQEAAGTTGAGEPQAARGPRGDEVGPGQREHGRLDMTGVSDMVSYSGAEEGPREGHRVGGGAAQRGSICGARRNGGGAEGAGEVQTLQVEGGLEGEEGRGLRSAERAKSAGAGEREKVQQGMQRGDVGAPRVVHVGLTEEEVRWV